MIIICVLNTGEILFKLAWIYLNLLGTNCSVGRMIKRMKMLDVKKSRNKISPELWKMMV